jgi:hypothetical protein
VQNDHHRLRRSDPATDTPLPPERAFVVQLRPLNDPRAEVLVGRVEHIASGAVGRFASAAELTTFIARIGRSASPGDPPPTSSTGVARAVTAGEHDATVDDA